jgi:Reverse transcriptase (RNA-dependent DNA polymerase)
MENIDQSKTIDIYKWTIPNKYPLPLITDLIHDLAGKKLFSKFDIRWGYNNVHIKEGDEWKGAFKTSEGLFEPTVMFFGLTNSPATFQTMMDDIFQEEIAQGWLKIYMDDMIIATEDDEAFHTQKVNHVLQKLIDHDLFLKPEKCQFHKKCYRHLLRQGILLAPFLVLCVSQLFFCFLFTIQGGRTASRYNTKPEGLFGYLRQYSTAFRLFRCFDHCDCLRHYCL